MFINVFRGSALQTSICFQMVPRYKTATNEEETYDYQSGWELQALVGGYLLYVRQQEYQDIEDGHAHCEELKNAIRGMAIKQPITAETFNDSVQWQFIGSSR